MVYLQQPLRCQLTYTINNLYFKKKIMADYLKQFNTTAEYNTYINGTPDLPNVSLTLDNNEVHYNKKPDYSKEYFTLVALANNMTFSWSEGLEYSTDDGQTWTSASSASGISQGTKIKLRGTLKLPTINYSSNFFNAKGNIMSLFYGDDFVGKTSFPLTARCYRLFTNSNIVNAKNLILPATTLTQGCYEEMFKGCTSLTTAPELPATEVRKNCYRSMFYGCTSLTTAPTLPTPTLSYDYCYFYMFYGCTNLNSITMLATNISASNCLTNWVDGVAATGTFTKAASATIPTGVDGIPSGWTVVDA